MECIAINPHTSGLSVFQNLIKKEVLVDVTDNKQCRGWVQSIDPVSKSFILLKFEDKKNYTEVTFIPGYNIKDVHIFHKEPSKEISEIIDRMFLKEEVYFSKADIKKRREALCLWFSQNRIPHSVSSNFNIEVLQVATIVPPYTTASIRCKNEIILDKIMKLVREAPGMENNFH